MNRKEYNRQNYLKNREERLAAQKAYYSENKERRQAYNRQYAIENAEAIKAQRKQYRVENKEKLNAAMRDWYLKNAEYAKVQAKEYREANREKLNEWGKQYRAEREKSDPVFKLARRLRTLIYLKISTGGYTKRSKTNVILGCTFEEFKTFIEQKFDDRMSWDNYGQWHLDHIVPVASAVTEGDVIRLNHYTNFQPLWATDNLQKGKKHE